MRELRIRGYVVGQPPNPPLWAALVGIIASSILDEGSTANEIARAVFYAGFASWAYLELSDGVNGFRKLLGAAGLLLCVVMLASELG